jgi:hypothetical protein
VIYLLIAILVMCGAFIAWASLLLPGILCVLGLVFGLACFFSGLGLIGEVRHAAAS